MLAALIGGALIGLGATIFWFANDRIAGVTGIIRDALRGEGSQRWVSLSFLAGLASAGLVFLSRFEDGRSKHGSFGVLMLAGLLAGFGARLGGGCTSGHGVCGIARLSRRSVVATLTFMATGAVAVFVTRHVLPAGGGAP
jgi:uncharacterized membrane protein YedE/YeeE